MKNLQLMLALFMVIERRENLTPDCVPFLGYPPKIPAAYRVARN